MLKASTLVYALFISLLLASIGSAVISLFYINSINILIWNEKERINRNAKSGITFIQGNNEGFFSKKEIDLFGTGNDQVILTKKKWGGFEVNISQAFSKHHQSTQIALCGSSMMRDSTVALYLADHNKPLSLCGKTMIIGNCYLPKAGIKRAYIEGQHFIGAQLIQGTMQYSSQEIELPDESFIKIIEEIATIENSEADSIVPINQDLLKNYQISFLSKTLVLRANTPIRLDTNKIIGNVVLYSDKQITIGSNATIKDIIVCAPKITIENGFSGCLQAITSDSLIVQSEVKLQYPSLLILVRSMISEKHSSIQLKERSKLSGGIFAFQQEQGSNNSIVVLIDKDASVTGRVYTNGSLDLKGEIRGNVICNNFLLKTPSSIYENHLLNATINCKTLPRYFITASFLKMASGKKLVKWLY